MAQTYPVPPWKLLWGTKFPEARKNGGRKIFNTAGVWRLLTLSVYVRVLLMLYMLNIHLHSCPSHAHAHPDIRTPTPLHQIHCCHPISAICHWCSHFFFNPSGTSSNFLSGKQAGFWRWPTPLWEGLPASMGEEGRLSIFLFFLLLCMSTHTVSRCPPASRRTVVGHLCKDIDALEAGCTVFAETGVGLVLAWQHMPPGPVCYAGPPTMFFPLLHSTVASHLNLHARTCTCHCTGVCVTVC